MATICLAAAAVMLLAGTPTLLRGSGYDRPIQDTLTQPPTTAKPFWQAASRKKPLMSTTNKPKPTSTICACDAA